MAKPVLAILGSSRVPGNTSQALARLMRGIGETVNLGELQIEPYSYNNDYNSSDYTYVISRIIDADCIVLATPVYWYSMSAQMKAFVDRLTDLVTHAAPLGRELAGKQIYGLFTSSDDRLPPGFLAPFKLTADYLGMHWGGHLHLQYCAAPSVQVDGETRKLALFSEAISDGKRFGPRVT